jgi:flagellar biosynthesis anti-sigma factor FlgM
MDIKKVYGDLATYSPQKLSEAAKSQQTAAKQTSDIMQQSGDKVAISSQAKLLGAALNVANSSSDVRTEKVRSLKEQVQSGTYKPDIRKAAANLLRDEMGLSKA